MLLDTSGGFSKPLKYKIHTKAKPPPLPLIAHHHVPIGTKYLVTIHNILSHAWLKNTTKTDQVMGYLRTYHLMEIKGPQVLPMCGGQPMGRYVDRMYICSMNNCHLYNFSLSS